MSDDSIERRRLEREERRKRREEERKREEEEFERAQKQRQEEREARRRAREQQAAEELAAIESSRSPRRTTPSADADKEKEEEKRKQEEAEEEEKEKAAAAAAAEEKKKKEQEREEREAREKEERRKAREQKKKEEEAEEKEREEARRKKKQQQEAEEEEERQRQEKEKERKREEEKAAASSSSSSSSAEVSQLKDENDSLKLKCRKLEGEVRDLKDDAEGARKELASTKRELESLQKEVESLKRAQSSSTASASSSSGDSSKLEEENAELKKEIEKLKAAAVGSSDSAAPRLTTATRSRPTKSGRRGQTVRPSSGASLLDDDEDGGNEEEEVKKPAPVRSTGNKAADLLAATMRGAMGASGGLAGLKKASGGNVFVSAGTKGGEISRCLFQLKGKTRIRAVRVQDSPKSFTNNDVFILETKTHIWTYIGPKASRLKIARAVDVVGKMQRQRGQARSATLETVDNKQQHDPSVDKKRKAFWEEFKEGEPSEIAEGVDDVEWELDYEAKTNLFRVDPGFELELVSQGKLMQESLETDKIFLLDTPNEMFVWCGRGSDVNVRKEAVEQAQEMLNKAIADGLKPSWVEVERVAERGEGALFEDKFFKWSDSMRKIIGKVAHKALSNVAVSDAAKKQELPRIKEMLDGELIEPTEYTSEVSGKPEIVIVKDFRRVDLPSDEHGVFYTKNCYIILYRYEDTGVFYFWLGRDAGVTEMGSAANLTKDWAGESGLNRPNLVRIEQGHEPKHFLKLFKGKMVALLGEHGSKEKRDKSLFHIRGTDEGNTRTFECPHVHGSYLNSDDAFVLNTKDSQFIWTGSHCAGLLHDVAKHVANLVSGSRGAAKTMEEGGERSEFKDAIEWVSDYAKHETRPNNLPVKLFICSNSNKQYRADRQAEFVQADLMHGNQAILDRHSEVIVWVGKNSKKDDKKIAMEVAVDYVEKSDDGRKNCEVWVLDEGEEVVDFSRYFQAWDPFRVKSGKKHITQGPPLLRKDSTMVKASEILSGAGGNTKFPLKKLLDRDYLPPGVDKKCLENHLQDSDFPEAFGVTAAEFWALPGWKRLEKKKKSPLF